MPAAGRWSHGPSGPRRWSDERRRPAAGSGADVLVTWTSRGGSLRPGAGAAGSPPSVIFGHFGLALGGLVIWVVYLVAGRVALAWTAVGVLLPVAGLGMAAVTIGPPGSAD